MAKAKKQTNDDTVLVFLADNSSAGRLAHAGMFYERGAKNSQPMTRADFERLAEQYGLVELAAAEEAEAQPAPETEPAEEAAEEAAE